MNALNQGFPNEGNFSKLGGNSLYSGKFKTLKLTLDIFELQMKNKKQFLGDFNCNFETYTRY